jgi:hypothetical protein
MKLRFSLGGLLLATTLVGVACLWRSYPKSVAEDFATAVAAGDYATADAMFARTQDAFLVDFVARHYRNKIRVVEVPQQSVGEWLKGDCQIELQLIDGSGLGAIVLVSIPVDLSGLGQYRHTGGEAGFEGFFDPFSSIER